MNYDNTTDQKKQEILAKISTKKHFNTMITDVLEKAGQNRRAEYIKECATYIQLTTTENDVKITNANFCRQRLCNVCAWRRQAKYFSQMCDVDKELKRIGYETERNFIFITLTIRNISAFMCDKAVDNMLKAWKKLLDYKILDYRNKKIEGYCRSLEVTYNTETNTFHPHIHAVICTGTPDFIIDKNKLAEAWKKALNATYTPIVDVRKCTSGTEKECMKYALKYNIKSMTQEVIMTMLTALHGRRLVAFGGIYAKIRKKLNMMDFEENLLDDVSSIETSKKVIIEHFLFNTSAGIFELMKGE